LVEYRQAAASEKSPLASDLMRRLKYPGRFTTHWERLRRRSKDRS